MLDKNFILAFVLPSTWISTEYNNQSDPDTFFTVGAEEENSSPVVLHQFKDYVSGNTATLEWEGQSTIAPTISEIFLQIYNRDTAAWETVDSDSATAADTDFILTADMTDLTDYKNASGVISCRVYQETV
jgi:hypothetical protein